MILCPASSYGAQTLHLDADDTWQNVAESADGGYMLAVANIKQLITAGKPRQAQQALADLKNNFSEIAGPDLEVFMQAEMLYAQGKWIKAVRKYDELLDGWPNSWLYESAIERNYSIAIAFLNGQKRRVLKVLKLSAYDESVKMLYQIADRAGDAPIAKRSLLSLAAGQEKMGKYLDAYETWADISARWPTGQIGRDSLLGMGRSLHSAYKGPAYDYTGLKSAHSYYENFKLRYPGQAQEEGIDEKIATIDEQLAYKQYAIGLYYEKSQSQLAAKLYYQTVVDNWPDSSAAQMATAKLQGQAENDNKKNDLRKTLFNASWMTGCFSWDRNRILRKKKVMRQITKNALFVCLFSTGPWICLALVGCDAGGYSNQWLYPDDISSVYVEMFDTTSFRRGHEYVFTDAVCKRIEAQTPYKIISDRDLADTILSGNISVGHGMLARDRFTGRPLEREAFIRVTFSWKNLKTGDMLIDNESVNGFASYSSQLGQNFDYASGVAANRAAERVVELMETNW